MFHGVQSTIFVIEIQYLPPSHFYIYVQSALFYVCLFCVFFRQYPIHVLLTMVKVTVARSVFPHHLATRVDVQTDISLPMMASRVQQ